MPNKGRFGRYIQQFLGDDMEGCTITADDWSDGKIQLDMECAIESTTATSIGRGIYNAKATS